MQEVEDEMYFLTKCPKYSSERMKLLSYVDKTCTNFEKKNIISEQILWLMTTEDIAQQTHDVNTTSPQRRSNVMTLHRRCINVICLLGNIIQRVSYFTNTCFQNKKNSVISMSLHPFSAITKRARCVDVTSHQHRCDVTILTLIWRCFSVDCPLGINQCSFHYFNCQ